MQSLYQHETERRKVGVEKTVTRLPVYGTAVA
jgi:hypothetical protein